MRPVQTNAGLDLFESSSSLPDSPQFAHYRTLYSWRTQIGRKTTAKKRNLSESAERVEGTQFGG